MIVRFTLDWQMQFGRKRQQKFRFSTITGRSLPSQVLLNFTPKWKWIRSNVSWLLFVQRGYVIEHYFNFVRASVMDPLQFSEMNFFYSFRGIKKKLLVPLGKKWKLRQILFSSFKTNSGEKFNCQNFERNCSNFSKISLDCVGLNIQETRILVVQILRTY